MTELLSSNLSKYIIAVVVIGALVVCAIGLMTMFSKSIGDFEKKPILTENEKEFFGRLLRALPDFHVFPQVAMGAILDAREKNDFRRRMSLRGRFDRKIVDFVVADEELEIVAIIELDDRTHDAEKDAIRDSMTNDAGYRTIRWESRNKPSLAEIRQTVLDDD